MPKPSRCRRVCAEPLYKVFNAETKELSGSVTLTVDEFEVIRLVDFEKRTHEQCAQQMQISRTTVTEIYENARFKIANAIVNGKTLYISGGHYKVCDGTSLNECSGRCCKWRRNSNPIQHPSNGENIMKIAIPVKSENIYRHFGMASEFKIYHVENNQLMGTETVNATGRGHGVMLDLLVTHNVNCVICGGIGDGAIRALEQNGIQLFAGITGAADDAVSALLAGTLQSDMQAACSKHQHAHHGQCSHGECGHHDGGCHCDCKH